MQFVKNGPDIPERLLQAHEDGQVVFFCGAGISYPAGLPGFGDLVKRVYANLAVQRDPEQQAAFNSGRFDTAIGLLEEKIVGGRKAVRKALAEILLKPDLSNTAATATHEALLTLGKNREGRTRLVTTNFDRLFEEVIASRALNIARFQAPLPVPKRRWDGLMYLHGLLSAEPSESELDRLVVSSGDFGLAYLTERWAARFLSELFLGYSVCFVGYSLNDPVLRYMMDALAADRLLGESPPEMFAFGSFLKGKEETCENEWRARNVTPILYYEPEPDCHAHLHNTLCEWAETYRDGVRGKERIVDQYAAVDPSESTPQDNFVSRMRWALSDPSGLPAQRFAELNPVPSLDWLAPLSEKIYGHADLARFGVPPEAAVDKKLTFSLLNRPPPYPLAPWMSVIDNGAHGSDWDKVMWHLAHWLTRHLDDPKLLLWLAERGGQLHEAMAEEIECRLDELDKLKRDGKTAELARIRKNAPRAIPGEPMRTLWRFMLTGYVKSKRPNLAFHRWCRRFERYDLTSTLRLELRKMLTPRISLGEPSLRQVIARQLATEGEKSEPKRIKDLVAWEIVLSTDHVHTNLRDLSNNERWIAALPELLYEFNVLLRDALDLMRELDNDEDRIDSSYIWQPSISEHEQNRKLRDWTALIDLNRDAWLATARQSAGQAALVAESWSNTPYSLFKRLAFFAAAQDGVIPPRRALDWLLADERRWLWSGETKREALRLLVSLAPRLDAAMLRELEQAVLAGRSREMYPDIEPEHWTLIEDREIWLRLAKIAEAGAVLSEDGKKRMEQIQAKYPESKWKLEEDQRDEFSGWGSDGSEWRKVTSPRRRRELIQWLRQNPGTDLWQEDGWRERCRDNFATSACALYALAREDFWPKYRWREALEVWSREKYLKRSWRYIAPVVVTVPDAALQALAHHISCWLRDISRTFEAHEAHFFTLAERILALDIEDDINTGDLVGQAINHPMGRITEALLNWYQGSLQGGQGLPEKLKETFTGFCDTRIDKFRHARVLLARYLITLFRVDRDWTTQHLLPLFDWQVSQNEAGAVWQGFLWSSPLYRPLMEMEAFRRPFLDTATHYDELGTHLQQEQYAALLTFAALDPGDTFTKAELASATRSLPVNGLRDAAWALVRALESAGDQRADYWRHRVAPYLREIWPQTRDRVSPEISESLGCLCIAAQDQFPEALKQLQDWLQAAEPSNFLVNQLHKAGLCKKFPEQALEFLSRVISEQTQYLPDDLGDCLKKIESASPELKADQRFERLRSSD